ncbi:MAG: type II toxin-antitoxin system RatA family toxin [Sphingomonadales bacterium]|nr:type II toxin-antitoxin system RatA family toxin [Sphingomonadales bacterium]
MPRHEETRHLPYSADQMYDLVADVASYDQFLPWVVAVRVRSQGETEMVADLIVGFKALREQFTSRVVKHRPDRVSVDYLDGPLKYLHNEWHFRDLPAGGCEIEFCVDFAFRSGLFNQIAGSMFDRALRKMIGAFEARADELYGAQSPRASSFDGDSSSSANSTA